MNSTILQINKTSPRLTITEFTQGILEIPGDPRLKIISGESRLVIPQETIEILSIGTQGPAGVDGDAHYTHVQILASALWDVHHNLGKRPSVTVVDSADTVVIGDVEYINDNRLKVRFSSAFGGKLYVN